MKRGFLWVFLILFALPGCGTTGLPGELIFQGDLDQAEKSLREDLNAQRSNPDSNLQMAALQYQRGDYLRARRYVRAVLATRANDDVAHQLLGLIATAEGNYNEAVGHFVTAVELNPERAGAMESDLNNVLKKALVQANEEGAFGGAVQYAKRLETSGISLSESEREAIRHAYLGMGKVHMEGGYFRAALAAFSRADRQNPTAESLKGKAIALTKLGELEASWDAFLEYVGKLDESQRGQAYQEIGNDYEESFRLEMAQRAYDAGLALEGKDTPKDLLIARAGVLMKLRDLDGAEAAYLELISSLPKEEQVDTWLTAVKQFLRFKDQERSIRILDKTIADFPHNLRPVSVLARVHLSAGNKEKVAELYRQYLERNNDSAAWSRVSEALANVGLYDLAIDVYREGYAKGAIDASALLEVGHLYEIKRDWEERNKAFSDYVKASGETGIAYEQVGLKFQEYGNDRSMEFYLKEALKVDAGLEKSVFALADLYRKQKKSKKESRVIKAYIKGSEDPERAELLVASRAVLQGNLDRAKKIYERLVRKGSDSIIGEAYYGLIEVALRRETPDWDSVRHHARGYLDSAKDRVAALRKLGKDLGEKSALHGLMRDVFSELTRLKPEEKDAWYQLAILHVETGNPEGAMTAFLHWVALNENAVTALHTAVGFLLDKKWGDTALSLLSAYEEKSVDPDLDRIRGLLLMADGPRKNVKKARAAFVRYFENTTANGHALRELGDALFDAGLFALSIRAYQLAQHRGTPSERLAERFAVAHLRLAQPEQAQKMFDLFLAREKEAPGAHEAVAQMWLDSGYLSRATSHFLKAFVPEYEKRTDRIFQQLSEIYQQMGKMDEIPKIAERFVSLQKESPAAGMKAAKTLEEIGLAEASIAQYKELVDAENPAPEVLESMGRQLLWLGRYDEALRVYARHVQLRNFDGGVLVSVSRLLEGHGLLDEALGFYNQGVERGTTYPPLYMARGALLMRKGERERARADFEYAVAQEKLLGPLLKVVVQLYEAAGQPKAAFSLVRNATARTDDPQARQLLVRILLDRGQTNRAIEEARSLLAQHPSLRKDIASLFDERGLFQEAISLYVAEMETNSDSSAAADAFLRAAELLRSFGAPRLLDSLVSKIEEGAKGDITKTAVMADLYLRAGNRKKGKKFLLKAVEHFQHGQMRLWLAQLLFGNGEFKEGARWLESFVSTPFEEGKFRSKEGRVKEALLLCKLYDQKAVGNDLLQRALAEMPENGTLVSMNVLARFDRGEIADGMAALESFYGTEYDMAWEDLRSITIRLQGMGAERQGLAVLERLVEQRFDSSLVIELARLQLRLAKHETHSKSREEKAFSLLDELLERQLAGRWIEVYQSARMLMDEGVFERAEGLLQGVVLAHQKSSWRQACLRLMKIHLLRGDIAAAGAVYQEIVDNTENKLEAYQGLQLVTRDLQLWSLEADALQSLIRLEPLNVEHRRRLIQNRLHSSSEKEVFEAVDELLLRSEDRNLAISRLIRNWISQFRYEFALRLVTRQMKTDRSDAVLRLLAGRLSLENGDDVAAAKYFTQYISLHDDQRVAKHQVALSYLEIYAPLRKDSVIEEALRTDGHDLTASLRAGRRALQWGEIEEARTAFFTEAKNTRQEAWILGQASELFFLSSDMPISLAKELADAALEMSPDLPDPVMVNAVIHLLQGNMKEARKGLEHYLRLGYQIRRGLKRFANAALRTKNYPLARESLERLVGLPEERRELVESAIGVLRDFLSHSQGARTPEDNVILRDMAMKYVNQLLETSPYEPWFLTLQSDVLEATGAVDEAVAVYRMAMERNPVDSSVYNNLAYLFARRGEQLDEALVLVQQAQALEPRHSVYYLDTEGWVAFQQGRYADAERLIRGSLKQMSEDQGPTVSESFWHLGKVFVQQGRVPDAKRIFFKALRIDPNGIYGRRARAELEALNVLPPRPKHVGELNP